ncbi:MAG TPA: chemotaxis protein CheB [Urbifossiella sp.]|jgi:two-component system chemotaxis response regulator CheB|nr:chemotaxis protein CheB [Urbifossiella sp.]
MPKRDIIVIGASTGGVDSLTSIVRHLPPGLPATLFIVCHIPPGTRSYLPEILSRSGPLLAVHARDLERFQPGQIYVAPPDQHLLLLPGNELHLNRDARENHARPAIDPLFRSAARCYGTRAIGVILTGALNDGAAGLMAIRAARGVGIVQDPREAVFASMPQTAVNVAGADLVLTVDQIAPRLIQLVNESVNGSPAENALPDFNRAVEQAMSEQIHDKRNGDVSVFTCPECSGALWQIGDEKLLRFRCHVGHTFEGGRLLSDQTEALEAALWVAIRTFREKSVLGRQLAERESKLGNAKAVGRFLEQAEQAEQYAEQILKLLKADDNLAAIHD